MVEHLERYVVADRVQPRRLGDMQGVGLVGKGVQAALERLDAWPLEPWSTRTSRLGGSVLQVSRLERLGVPAVTIWVPSSIAPDSIDELCSLVDATPVGHAALEIVRIESGLARWGIDYDDSNLPQESSIEGVDFEKGCYLGQEVIARLHYRGQAPKRVCRLELEGLAPGGNGELRGTELVLDDRAAGVVTSWVALVAGRPAVALGMIARRAWEPGTELAIEGGGCARVLGPAG